MRLRHIAVPVIALLASSRASAQTVIDFQGLGWRVTSSPFFVPQASRPVSGTTNAFTDEAEALHLWLDEGTFNLNSIYISAVNISAVNQNFEGIDHFVTGGESGRPASDDIGVTTNPEPGTMILMASGLAALGGAVRRRRAARNAQPG